MRIRIAVAGVMHGADLFNKQFRVQVPNGTFRWVSAQGSAERDADNRVISFNGLLRHHRAKASRGASAGRPIGGRRWHVRICQRIWYGGRVRAILSTTGPHANESVALRAIDAVLPEGCAPLIGGANDFVSGELPYREVQITRPDTGESRWIARRGERRLDTPNGGSRLIGVIYDITDYKTVESRLRSLPPTWSSAWQSRHASMTGYGTTRAT